jgi:conjugal transfer pilus assembly protein TraW
MCCVATTSAKDLGIIGQTYAIAEEDFLQFIEARYRSMQASGEWEKVQTTWQQRMAASADRPAPLLNITTTTHARTFTLDPSVQIAKDILDAYGRIIVAAGTRVNPLQYRGLHKKLLFIDADDVRQIAWAKQQDKKSQTKWILVKGAIGDTIKQAQHPVYFDQGRRLVEHFHIEHVPAVVSQAGLRLKITEVSI